MLNLSNITLLCVETRDPELAHWAIDRCLAGTRFAKVVLITNLSLVKNKRADIEYVQALAIRTTKDYSDLLLMGIDQYVVGSHVLIIQWDSFITHPNLWRNEFLSYDYIGSVWPHHPQTPVGNGGFSLRSVKLLQAIKHSGFIKRHPEDYCICVDNKDFLEKECGIQFAPSEVAEQFSVERSEWHDAFGFHGLFNFGRVLSSDELLTLLTIAPRSFLSGVDSYDLAEQLFIENKRSCFIALMKKINFKWNFRSKYFSLRLKLLLVLCSFEKNFLGEELPPILFTSSVEAMDDTVLLRDQRARIFHTLEAIKIWEKIAPHCKFVICDGSGYDFTDVIDAMFPNLDVECLAFYNDFDEVKLRGKGFGEGEIILYALMHSRHLKDSKFFVKCTARLWVNNFQACIQEWNGRFLCKAYFSNVFSFKSTTLEYVDTRFYIADKLFYIQNFSHIHKNLNATKGLNLEEIFLKIINERGIKNFIFKGSPMISGMSGGSGVYYNTACYRRIKEVLRSKVIRMSLKYRNLFN